jgi:release factor glutamine methyltransferase
LALSHKVTIPDALRSVEQRLASAGVETPRVDAEILLARVLGTTRSALAIDRRRVLESRALRELEPLVARRERREPLAYVLGEWGFRRLLLTVDRRVLVPRPETEIAVERALARIRAIAEPRVLDVGTGSGAIALAIADEHPGAKVTAIDASESALEVARQNAERTGLEVDLRPADLFAHLPDGPWDLVVSNPPYVRPDEIEMLAPEVREWEPREALVAEGATEAVARASVRALRPGGALVLEVADGDAGRVAALLRDLGYADVASTNDLTGRERVVEGIIPA